MTIHIIWTFLSQGFGSGPFGGFSCIRHDVDARKAPTEMHGLPDIAVDGEALRAWHDIAWRAGHLLVHSQRSSPVRVFPPLRTSMYANVSSAGVNHAVMREAQKWGGANF